MYEISAKYRTMAEEIIENTDDLNFIKSIPVGYLFCDKKKLERGHAVRAQCIKVPDMYRVIGHISFVIVVYEPNCGGFDDEQYKILIEHELRHIGIGGDKTYIVPHDFERGEFDAIIKKYGEHWDDP